MSKVLINPTEEQIEEYNQQLFQKIQKENMILKIKNKDLIADIDWYKSIIETARTDWGRVGADTSLSTLVLTVKEKK